MTLEDVGLYLPKFLSTESAKSLFDGLKDFPENLDQRFYTQKLKDDPTIFQGDGIRDLLIMNLPSVDTKNAPGIVLSNTCDIEVSNFRNLPSRIVYAPILNLKKYKDTIEADSKKNKEQIVEHISAIKKQYVTQIFYLPSLPSVLEESIVFLDRLFNVDNAFVSRDELKFRRIFTLSDLGHYVFLMKLSIHFTRIQDKVDRGFQ